MYNIIFYTFQILFLEVYGGIPMAKKRGPVTSCIGCGRDTSAKDEICSRCRGKSHTFGDEEKGRKARSSQVIGGSPIPEFDEEDDVSVGDIQFHGQTLRDDI